jgi:hypothetical protein
MYNDYGNIIRKCVQSPNGVNLISEVLSTNEIKQKHNCMMTSSRDKASFIKPNPKTVHIDN